MRYEITSKKQYHETMVAIYNLMNKGEANLSSKEIKLLSAMTLATEKYEDEVLGLKPQKKPETIAEIIEIKLFEKRMTQVNLADELGMAKSKVSEILSGKRKPDVSFLKGVHQILKIDADFLLTHA